jgi:hypothetical protein
MAIITGIEAMTGMEIVAGIKDMKNGVSRKCWHHCNAG